MNILVIANVERIRELVFIGVGLYKRDYEFCEPMNDISVER